MSENHDEQIILRFKWPFVYAIFCYFLYYDIMILFLEYYADTFWGEIYLWMYRLHKTIFS